MRDRSPTRLAKLGILAAAYVAAGKLGLSMAILHPNASPVWPPTGIAIASLLLLGRSAWPAITLAAFVVNLTTTGHVASSVGIAIGNTLEAVIAVALVERFTSGRRVFDRAPDFLAYTVLAGFVATLVSATIGVTVLCVAPEQFWIAYGSTWWTWWLGDAGGALIVAPPLVLWGADAALGWSRWRALEGFGLLLSVVAAGELVFLGHFAPALSVLP